MDPFILRPLLWFFFGFATLCCLHKIVAKICNATTHCSDQGYEISKIELEKAKESTKSAQLTKESWQMKYRSEE